MRHSWHPEHCYDDWFIFDQSPTMTLVVKHKCHNCGDTKITPEPCKPGEGDCHEQDRRAYQAKQKEIIERQMFRQEGKNDDTRTGRKPNRMRDR